MKKLKLFLEFVSGSKKSLFVPLTYDEISKKLNCSIDEVEYFEIWLDDNIKPGKFFHGSFGSEQDETEKPVGIFDEIENETDYLEMWKQYKAAKTGHTSHSHHEEGL
jgi:hypothetical protein